MSFPELKKSFENCNRLNDEEIERGIIYRASDEQERIEIMGKAKLDKFDFVARAHVHDYE